MPKLVPPDGPIPAKIMIVGEAPGADEEAKGIPFVGASGQELNRMLHSAGIMRSECFVTNVARERPAGNDIKKFIAQSKKEITPRHKPFRDKMVLPPVSDGAVMLQMEIKQVEPRVIIALGNTAMWALTGHWGIQKWRGSMLRADAAFSHKSGHPPWVVPAIHPAAILREWSWRAITVSDFRRVARLRSEDPVVPEWRFLTRPMFEEVSLNLLWLLGRLSNGERLRLSFDIETGLGHIVCAGLAWSKTDAMCIPLKSRRNSEGYFTLEQETTIVHFLQQVLCHPNADVIGQNILYDSQYTWRHWLFVPRVSMDTMIAQHSVFSDLPKSLAFICSMVCNFYQYWKEDK